jgi:DNA-binding response OmpR family regulator
VIALEEGRLCLEAIEIQKPDLVLLDIMLPDCDGRDLLKAIRERLSSIQLPIIMVTAKVDSSDVVEALRFGANDYITKPVDTEIALMRVRTQLRIRELSRQATRLGEISAAHAMVVTYNHQLNNALAIALGHTQRGIRTNADVPCLQNIKNALDRMANVIQAIEEVTSLDKGAIETEAYVGDSVMLKLKLKPKGEV